MVILIVPAPCGTIFSIFLIIFGILTLPTDPQGGISMIIVGVIFLGINQVILGSSRPRGASMMNRPITFSNSNRSFTSSYTRGVKPRTVFICPQCNVEYTTTNSNSLCPNCQVPLKAKISSFGVQKHKTNNYFENQ